MLRRIAALAVAALVMPVLAPAADAPVADHAAASVAYHGSSSPASAPPSRPAVAPAVTATPSLRLVWLDPAGVVVGTQAVVEPEVAKLMRGMGVATEWRRGDAREIAQPGELRVIFLDRPAPCEQGAPVLGSTPSDFRGGQDTPFVWVHVPSVRAAVGLRPRGASFGDLASRRQVGIALARVIAHEVVHAVAPSLPHAGGLMSPRLDHRMLTAASIRLDPQLRVAVQSALAGAAPAPRAVPELLAAEASSYKEAYR